MQAVRDMPKMRDPLPPRKHSRTTEFWLGLIALIITVTLIAYSIWVELLARGAVF